MFGNRAYYSFTFAEQAVGYRDINAMFTT